jgi:superfamily II DNA or RNA helicase
MKLRDYQEEVLRISKQKWDAGVTRQLLALPTGSGKTCIFASLPKHHQIKGKMLVLVHRDVLAKQNKEKILRWNPGLHLKEEAYIEMGEKEYEGWEEIVIAGVQTLGRANSQRLLKFDPNSFDVIVCDEAHHSVAETYIRVFGHFGLFDDSNKKLLLGVTATPFRADDKELLPHLYQEIIYDMPILQAIDKGWLCDIRSYRIQTEANLDPIITRAHADDFPESQLEEAINNRLRNSLVAREWKKLAGNRRTIAFAVTVRHAKELAAAFRDYGVEAKAVWGDDPEREQKKVDHQDGRLQVLCNCGILTEGYDDCAIECIVMARPTLSRLLFVQMIGRGTRIEKFPGDIDNLVEARLNGLPITKPDCTVIDFVDNTTKHDLVTFPIQRWRRPPREIPK